MTRGPSSLTHSKIEGVDVLQMRGASHAQCPKKPSSLTYSKSKVNVLQFWGETALNDRRDLCAAKSGSPRSMSEDASSLTYVCNGEMLDVPENSGILHSMP